MIGTDEKPVYLGRYKPSAWQRGRVIIPEKLMNIIKARNPNEHSFLKAFQRQYGFRFLTLYGVDDFKEGDEATDPLDFRIERNRLYIPSAVQGRIQIPGDKKAIFMGLGNFIELWSESELARFYDSHGTPVIL